MCRVSLNKAALIVAVSLLALNKVKLSDAFQSAARITRQNDNNVQLILSPTLQSTKLSIFLASSTSLSETATDFEVSSSDLPEYKPSFYKTHLKRRNGSEVWKPRKRLEDLEIGEPLEGYLVQEHLEGATGPKIFLEVGIGRYNPKTQKWKIVHAMLRQGHKNTKSSVTTKRVARLRKKEVIECYVSRISLGSGQLEVVQNVEEIPRKEDSEKKTSVSSLKPGQELIGTVQKLLPYGAFVDVGANRNGLLHIQKVADLYSSYIDKEKGLQEAGLEHGARIRVQVESNEKKRLFLDFPPSVKEEAEKDRLERENEREKRLKAQQEKREANENKSAQATSTITAAATGFASASVASASSSQASKEEEDAWAADYQDNSVEDVDEEADYDDDDYDDYDEDRDIEDALGLGTY